MDGPEGDEAPSTADVTDRYDFESFGPADFEEMAPEEWEAAFDPKSWVTGEALLDRVHAELLHRVDDGDVFAVVERTTHAGEPCVLAYSDRSYAIVYPDGQVTGIGTVLRDVKPTVAVCSIEEYDVPPPPSERPLPTPQEVAAPGGDLGNLMLQLIGFASGLSGLILLGGWMLGPVPSIGLIVGLGFIVIAVFLLFVVANARLAARYRREGFRERLRGAGLEDLERPGFLPDDLGKPHHENE